jgi:hypothetical protein
MAGRREWIGLAVLTLACLLYGARPESVGATAALPES